MFTVIRTFILQWKRPLKDKKLKTITKVLEANRTKAEFGYLKAKMGYLRDKKESNVVVNYWRIWFVWVGK